MKVLVCGGAGYIGSHMVQYLADHRHSPVTFDNLSTGHADAVLEGPLFEGDVLKRSQLDEVFSHFGPFDAVMHFCAKSLVGESVEDPGLYYRNNVAGTLNLMDAMLTHGCHRLVFSSTAAVYGQTSVSPITETHPCAPINPYGYSKLMAEQMLGHYACAYGLRSVRLRYFNACGAHPVLPLGERHDPETHLIPNVLFSALGSGATLKVFGDDYPTPDGSCVRDYVHVNDLCQAHLAAINYLETHEGSVAFNLGNGTGFSVLDVIHAARRVTAEAIPYEVKERREGDPAVLIADAGLARSLLNWTPQFVSLDEIIETAWRFHLSGPR